MKQALMQVMGLQKHIFDLGSNVRKWTIEAWNTANRSGRGGYYDITLLATTNYRGTTAPTNTLSWFGARLVL